MPDCVLCDKDLVMSKMQCLPSPCDEGGRLIVSCSYNYKSIFPSQDRNELRGGALTLCLGDEHQGRLAGGSDICMEVLKGYWKSAR